MGLMTSAPRKGRQHRAHLKRPQALAQHHDPQQNGEEGESLFSMVASASRRWSMA